MMTIKDSVISCTLHILYQLLLGKKSMYYKGIVKLYL